MQAPENDAGRFPRECVALLAPFDQLDREAGVRLGSMAEVLQESAAVAKTLRLTQSTDHGIAQFAAFQRSDGQRVLLQTNLLNEIVYLRVIADRDDRSAG